MPLTSQHRNNTRLEEIQSESKRMWIRAVWLEGEKEEEGVVPESWAQDDKLYWPPGVDARKAFEQQLKPAGNWRQFSLLKIKLKSESKSECEDYDQTTAVETDDENETVVRKRKRKPFPDFVTGDILPVPPAKVNLKLPSQLPSQTVTEKLQSISDKQKSKGRTINHPEIHRSPSTSRSRSRSKSPSPPIHHSTITRSKSPSPPIHHSTITRSRSTSREKRKKEEERFPMPEGRFQRRVLFLLSEMKNDILTLKHDRKVDNHSNQFIPKVESMDEFKELENRLKVNENRQEMVQTLSTIGGMNIKDNVKKIMEKLMTNEIMANFNMKGTQQKLSFKLSSVCGLVIASAMKTKIKETMTEQDVMTAIQMCLKYAPDRRGGGGRKKHN